MQASAPVAAERRKLAFQDLDQLVAELQRLCQHGYRPAGQWSLSQICDHLAIFVRGSLSEFKTLLPWPIRFFVGKPLLRKILRNRSMHPGTRVPAVLLPGKPRDDAAAVADLVQLLRQFRDHRGPLRANPLFGELSPEQWTQLHLIHAAHHLSFLLANGATAGGTP
jgi:hypothetical protein